MKNIIITESQLLKLVNEGSCYLDKNDTGTDTPSDSIKFNGGEITGKDPDADVNPIGDKIAKTKVSLNPLARRSFVTENDIDNQTAYIGKKTQQQIQNLSGKMAKNISQRMKGKGQRLNTTEVEISRMEKAKKEDPITFEKNGGDATLKALESAKNRQRNSNKQLTQINKNINQMAQPFANKEGKGHHNKTNIYYDVEN